MAAERVTEIEENHGCTEARTAVLVAQIVRRELDDDYVGLWVLPWHIRRIIPSVDDAEVQRISAAILEALMADNAVLGELDSEAGVFIPWSVTGAVERAMTAWRSLDRDPTIGEVAWLGLSD